MSKKINKIKRKTPVKKIINDLKKYEDCIEQWGGDDAKIIDTKEIIMDIRVRAKCHFSCEDFNSNMNCPPNLFSFEKSKKLVCSYNYAIIFKLNIPSNVIAGELSDEDKKELKNYAIKRYQIIGRLEKKAFDDGFALALGFGGGPCSKYLCPNQKCQALIDGECKHPNIARPSMEAMGIDVYKTVSAIGWDIYPIGSHTDPKDVKQGVFVGIVFIE